MLKIEVGEENLNEKARTTLGKGTNTGGTIIPPCHKISPVGKGLTCRMIGLIVL
jgi:hypothetical protein